MAEGKRKLILILLLSIFSLSALLYVYNSQSFSRLLHSNVSDQKLIRKLPNSIIIGVKKGGTKALISMLDVHPNVKAAKGEVHYFDRDINYHQGKEWYLKRMPPTKQNDVCIEKSPSYFIYPLVPDRIIKLISDVKLMLIVRDPVTRTISDYTQLDAKRARKAHTRPSFEKFVLRKDGTIKDTSNVIRVSMYNMHLKRWLRHFPLERILIINGNQLVSDPYSVLVQVEQFLRIPKHFTKDMFYYNKTKGFYCWKTEEESTKCLGSSKGRKHPFVSQETLSKLRTFFRPHMKEFCSMAKVSFSWCNQ